MKNSLPDKITKILNEVKERLQKIYGNNLKGIVLYGSYARGDYSDGSDIDLIILLDDITDLTEERNKYFDEIWDLDLKYDTLISTIPMKEKDYQTRRLPVILNAKKEGILI